MQPTNDMIAHFGFHLGFDAQLSVPAKLVPEYPTTSDWFCLRERYGDATYDLEAKAAFVRGYQAGTKAEECSKCHGGVIGHKRYVKAVF